MTVTVSVRGGRYASCRLTAFDSLYLNKIMLIYVYTYTYVYTYFILYKYTYAHVYSYFSMQILFLC